MGEKIDNSISDMTVANNCLCYKLRATSRKVTRRYDSALKPVGLKANQFSIMVAISIMSPVSITDLSEALAMDRTTLTRNLRPLEKSGLIKLTDGYGRIRDITLSEEGVSRLKKAKPLWHSAQTKLRKELGESDSEQISQLLNQILKNELRT